MNLLAAERKAKKEMKRELDSHTSDRSVELSSKYFLNTPEIGSKDELIQYLYLNKSQNFKYQLVQNKNIELPLYRERNFRLV